MLPILAAAALVLLASGGSAHADPIITPVLTAAFTEAALSAGISVSASTIATAAGIASSAITLGAAFGLSMLGQQSPKVNPATYQIKQSQPSLVYGYGFARVGGAKFVYEAPGGAYIDGIVHSAGPIDGYQAWYLNDYQTGIPADTAFSGGFGGVNVTPPWRSKIVLESRIGLPNQPASGILTGHLGGTWTAAHQLNGLAYTVLYAIPVKKEDFGKYYPSGAPSIYALLRMAPLYDPRTGATQWSANAGLAVLHYLTAIRGTDGVTGKPVPFGFGFPLARIDLDSFAAFADVCDQRVPLKDGTSQLRYAIGGAFDMGQEARRDVLKKLLAACDGEIYQSAAGRIAIRGGIWAEPTVTISERHILGYEFEQGNGKLAAFNRLKISFCDPGNNYASTEADPWDDLAAQIASGEVLVQELSLPMVQQFGQARRLSKIATAKGNPRYKLTITTDLYGLMALGERIVRVQIAELGIDATFLVTSFVENADGCTCRIGISSLAASAYAWDPASEEGTPPVPLNASTQATAIPDVTGITTSVKKVTVSGTVTRVAIRASVDAPANVAFALQGRIRPQGAGDGDWAEMSADGDWAVASDALNDAATYEVQLAFGGYAALQGPWTASQFVAIPSQADPPDPPANVSVTARGGGTVAVDFTIPSSPNAASVNVNRASGVGASQSAAATVFSQAGSPGQAFEFDNSGLAPGHYRYWLQTLDAAGAGGGTAGPYDVDVT